MIDKSKTVDEPIEIKIQIGKTIQEGQSQPFCATVSAVAKGMPNEISSEFHRVYDILEEGLTTILNTRAKNVPKQHSNLLKSLNSIEVR